MRAFNEHLIFKDATVKKALELLNVLAPDSILFVGANNVHPKGFDRVLDLIENDSM